ncbi:MULTISPECIES: hypothetical protein [Rhizobium]|uniref:Uncharacterized protein n=1 Tax=Rhizobium fabae TaxID=573179 RepID=A0A7W6BA96_9HYPH|nr:MULTISPECIES: hypothetical protein [Rhizobium]MBB3917981.1 hypothetical protein [Rhizobium fabae]
MRDLVREKVIKLNSVARRPTIEEFLAFDGAHCRNIYRALPDDWQCPGCLRTKYQVLRWTTLFPHIPSARRPGWAGGYHTHHDHAGDRYRWMIPPSWFSPRFEPTVICEQCNSADASAKRKLNLPKDFSFTPFEIRQFVIAHAHGKHLIDYRVAQAIFDAVATLGEANAFAMK